MNNKGYLQKITEYPQSKSKKTISTHHMDLSSKSTTSKISMNNTFTRKVMNPINKSNVQKSIYYNNPESLM